MIRRASIALVLAAFATEGCKSTPKAPDRIETEQFSVPVPDGWISLELRHLPNPIAIETPIEAAIASPLEGGGGIVVFRFGSANRDCSELARAHAAADDATAELVSFTRDNARGCRWQYDKPPLVVITTRVPTNRVVQCAIKPEHAPSRAACDEVSRGFAASEPAGGGAERRR